MESCQANLITLFTDQLMRKLWNTYSKMTKDIYARNKMYFLLKIQMKGFLHRNRRFGHTLDQRLTHQLQNVLSFQVRVTLPFVEGQLMEALVPFLIEHDYRTGL